VKGSSRSRRASALLAERLDSGRPLILGSDPLAALRARGIRLEGDAPLGRLMRERPALVSEHYDGEIAAGVDVLSALTAETMPRALAQIGMAFRAAALTGDAVELAQEAAARAPRPIAVAGVLGTRWIAPNDPARIAEEYARHASRLAAADCDLLLARGWVSAPWARRELLARLEAPSSSRVAEWSSRSGQLVEWGRSGMPPDAPLSRRGLSSLPPPPPETLARLTRTAAIVSAHATGLPTWAVLELDASAATADGEPVATAARAAVAAGAALVLLEVKSPELGLRALGAVGDAGVPIGVLLADPHDDLASWAAHADRLIEAGARVLGGGYGLAAPGVAALAASLRDRESSPASLP
jgi:5-methyltetrahydrofolate--homocysteine methyltransferase